MEQVDRPMAKERKSIEQVSTARFFSLPIQVATDE